MVLTCIGAFVLWFLTFLLCCGLMYKDPEGDKPDPKNM